MSFGRTLSTESTETSSVLNGASLTVGSVKIYDPPVLKFETEINPLVFLLPPATLNTVVISSKSLRNTFFKTILNETLKGSNINNFPV